MPYIFLSTSSFTFLTSHFILQTCGHCLCKSCWNCLITESVDSGPSCLHRLCPAVGCTLVVPEEFVEKYCSEKLTAYRSFHLESFVAQNKVSVVYVFMLFL